MTEETKPCGILCGNCLPCLKELLALERDRRLHYETLVSKKQFEWSSMPDKDIMDLWQWCRVSTGVGSGNNEALTFGKALNLALRERNWQSFCSGFVRTPRDGEMAEQPPASTTEDGPAKFKAMVDQMSEKDRLKFFGLVLSITEMGTKASLDPAVLAKLVGGGIKAAVTELNKEPK